ncbi:MAG: RNA polymerase sigma factor [Breznakibacter sp.]|nr:RNA polymerase sigma factor [Breznakibacter sp.]
MKNNQDKKIIEQVLRGDVAAFSLIVEQYKKMVFTLALNILKNREDAEEATQDTFFKAYQSLAGFKGESSVSTWLYRIVYHTSISMLRKRKETTVDLDGFDRMPASSMSHQPQNGQRLEIQDRKRMLKEALMQLEEDDAFVVLLYYYKEQSVEEIAAITSLSISNVKVKLHRSRKKLQEILSVTMKTEMDSLL